MEWILLLGAVLIFIAGFILLLRARRLHATTGLPTGTVVYADTAEWQPQTAPLISRRYGLVGKPDYVLRLASGALIPVEVKSRRRPAQLPRHHLLQLATYCLLVEETAKQTPPHGLLHYADATLQIPFTPELRRAVLETAEAIRRGRSAADLDRDHADSARCRHCGVRYACAQALG